MYLETKNSNPWLIWELYQVCLLILTSPDLVETISSLNFSYSDVLYLHSTRRAWLHGCHDLELNVHHQEQHHDGWACSHLWKALYIQSQEVCLKVNGKDTLPWASSMAAVGLQKCGRDHQQGVLRGRGQGRGVECEHNRPGPHGNVWKSSATCSLHPCVIVLPDSIMVWHGPGLQDGWQAVQRSLQSL